MEKEEEKNKPREDGSHIELIKTMKKKTDTKINVIPDDEELKKEEKKKKLKEENLKSEFKMNSKISKPRKENDQTDKSKILGQVRQTLKG